MTRSSRQLAWLIRASPARKPEIVGQLLAAGNFLPRAERERDLDSTLIRKG